MQPTPLPSSAIEPMESLAIAIRWDARVHQWHASCAAHPSIAARAPTPSRARGALLRKIKRALGQHPTGQVSETFVLPDTYLAKHQQWRTERAAAAALQASIAALERDLVLSLRSLRLSIAQVARIVELAPQHVDAVLQSTAMCAGFGTTGYERRPVQDPQIASSDVQPGQHSSTSPRPRS